MELNEREVAVWLKVLANRISTANDATLRAMDDILAASIEKDEARLRMEDPDGPELILLDRVRQRRLREQGGGA